MLSESVKQFDMRQVVFGSLYRVGFDLHELSFAEKQYMEIIQLYPFFKNGEVWADIQEELDDEVSADKSQLTSFCVQNCQPSSDDCHWMETVIEETQEQAVQAAVVQNKLHEDSQVNKQGDLDNYFAAVRIKSQINAIGGNKGNGKSRL